MSFHSILTASQFSTSDLIEICEQTSSIELVFQKKRRIPVLEDYILATLFFEPSTRTRLSFESAMHSLGGNVITAVGIQFSSLSKGESIHDTLKMIEYYADICVIRHPQEGIASMAAQNIQIPVINGGDGAKEHPTQALLDLYTIHKYKNIIVQKKKLVIALVGDVEYSRTIHSLIILLAHFDIEFIFIHPKELSLPQEYYTLLDKKGVSYDTCFSLEDAKHADVFYVTRIQEERFADRDLYESIKNHFIINKNFLKSCKKDCIVMHPLPRTTEINVDVDSTSHSVYFEQAKNGIYIRMLLILRLLDKDISILI